MENKWKSMTAEKSAFIVEKGEKVMECIISDREILQKKANWLLGLIGGIVTLALGLWLKTAHSMPDVIGRAVGIEIVLLLSCGVALTLLCLMPSKYAAPGACPSLLLKPEFANQDIQWLQIGYCNLIQNVISTNLARNKLIAKRIKIITVCVLLTPIVSFFGGVLNLPQFSPPVPVKKSASIQLLEHYSVASSFRLEHEYQLGLLQNQELQKFGLQL